MRGTPRDSLLAGNNRNLLRRNRKAGSIGTRTRGKAEQEELERELFWSKGFCVRRETSTKTNATISVHEPWNRSSPERTESRAR